MVKRKDVMVLYDNGDRVMTSDGRSPGYRGHLNKFDLAMLDLVNKIRPLTVYTIETNM